jgi:hypothetical protein
VNHCLYEAQIMNQTLNEAQFKIVNQHLHEIVRLHLRIKNVREMPVTLYEPQFI